MSAPGIERVEAAVVAQLQKIQVANGYRSDVEHVYRVPLNADQIPDGCSLVVIPMPDGMALDPGSAHYKLTDRLIIGGLVKTGEADLLDPARATLTNYLLQDTIDALMEDVSFGFKPNLDSVLEVGDRGIDADRHYGYFSLRLHLLYPFARRTM